MFGYLVGHMDGPNVERTIIVYTSHRKITGNM